MIPVLFRGKLEYMKEENLEWVRSQIRGTGETLDEALERIWIQKHEAPRERELIPLQQQAFIPSPGTMDFYIPQHSHIQSRL